MDQPYLERQVPEVLQPLVRRMWWLRMPTPQPFELIVPIPAVHLVVNLSTPYRVVRRGSEQVDERFPGPFLSGIQTEYLLNENPAEIHHVGAELAPWALPAFGIDPSTVAEQVRDASGPMPGAASVRTLDDLESLLRARLDPRWSPDARIRTAVESITEHPERPIGAVAEASGLTSKGFLALFRRHVGIAPKLFAAVCRHHDFLQRLPREGELPSWTELLSGGRYYDQPAFIREFRRFTGMTPTAYLELRREHGWDDPSFLALGSAV